MNEKMYKILHHMIEARRDYWREHKLSCAWPFADALDLLEYAHNEDIDALSQFDFFPEEE